MTNNMKNLPLNIHLKTTKRNMFGIIEQNRKTLYKTSLGLLNIKSQDRKTIFATEKFNNWLIDKLSNKNLKLNIYIDSWTKNYKKIVYKIMKNDLIINRIIFQKSITFNGTKIRHARRK